MIELTPNQAPQIAELFRYTDETLIHSFVQGHHGRGWVDAAGAPRCAQVAAGSFSFFAGDASLPAASALVANRATGWTIAIPQDDGWGARIRSVYGERCRRVSRYALKKEGDIFDRTHLRRIAAGLPEGYRTVPIDAALYHRVLKIDLARDYVSNFRSPEDFLQRGIGFVALYSGEHSPEEIAGGASSYTVYDGGIEIEISTLPAHRRRGIAAACAATLILACLERGLYPSWDAANTNSLALAEKLGYHFDGEYDAYIIESDSEA